MTPKSSEFDWSSALAGQTVAESMGEKSVRITHEEPTYKVQSELVIPTPNPIDLGVVQLDAKGRPTISKNAIIKYLERLYIVYSGQRPYQFNGRVYQPIDEADIRYHIYQSIDDCRIPSLDCPTKSFVADIIAKYQSTHFFSTIEIPEEWEDFDYRTENLVPFRNGILNLDTGELLPFTPYVWLTYCLDVDYNPTILDHEVESIYRGILPDDTTRQFFYQAVGYTVLSSSLSVPALFLVYGGGNTGKSALQEAIVSLVGRDNVSTLGMNQISGDFTTYMMEDKLANFCGETGDKPRDFTRIDGELLKRLAEGQPITVQRKHGQPYQITPTAKMWFISNTMPDFGDSSSGLTRRLYIMPCRQVQSWRAQIYHRMQTEDAKSWLVNQAIYWYRQFLDAGKVFRTSPEMDGEKAQFVVQDSVSEFLVEFFESGDKEVIKDGLNDMPTVEVYTEYRMHAESNGSRPLGKKKFVEKLRNEYDLELKVVGCTNAMGKKSTRTVYIRKGKGRV